MKYYPGTIVEKSELSGAQFLQGIFITGNGLIMRQLNEITGITVPAIQNWVARGFISHPEQKRYSKNSVARIFIINALRQTMNLDDIKKLLVFVNGKVDDKSDDIIEESELYAYFCEIVFDEKFSFNSVEQLIDRVIANYSEKIGGAKQKLKTALEIICINHLSATLQNRSNALMQTISQQNFLNKDF